MRNTWASLVAQMVKNSPATQETWIQSLDGEDPLEKEMAGNAIDGSPPDSPVPGILQARTLEWVAISFSNAWKLQIAFYQSYVVQICF